MQGSKQQERYQQFIRLYEEYADRILNYLLYMLKSRPDAEEVMQNAILRLYRNLDRFDEKRGKMSTWLYAIAKNLAYNCLKHRRYEPDRSIYEKVKIGDEEVELLKSLPDKRDISADKVLEAKELRKKVRNAIKLLIPAYREVIMFCDIHQMPHKEVAGLLKCSVNAVDIRLTRARKRLADIIKYP